MQIDSGGRRDRRDSSRLRMIVRKHIMTHSRDASVDPYKIASNVLEELEPHDSKLAAHLQLRHLARELLRREFEVAAANDSAPPEAPPRSGRITTLQVRQTAQSEPEIPNLLQDRYPQANHAGYIKRELMSEADWRWNIARLEHEGRVKNEHAAALREWGEANKGWDYRASDGAA